MGWSPRPTLPPPRQKAERCPESWSYIILPSKPPRPPAPPHTHTRTQKHIHLLVHWLHPGRRMIAQEALSSSSNPERKPYSRFAKAPAVELREPGTSRFSILPITLSDNERGYHSHALSSLQNLFLFMSYLSH